jgi:hypothetical protein
MGHISKRGSGKKERKRKGSQLKEFVSIRLLLDFFLMPAQKDMIFQVGIQYSESSYHHSTMEAPRLLCSVLESFSFTRDGTSQACAPLTRGWAIRDLATMALLLLCKNRFLF